jgi:tetratricopeptide (TPR) repeat protein
MKKLVFFSFLTVLAVFAFAQDASTAAPDASPAPVAADASPATATTPNQPSAAPSTTAAQDSYNYESDHYSVRSYVSADHAQAVAERLEAYQVEFNRYFHFDTEKQGLKLKVRIFANKARFDQYLQRIINETRSDFVYLHYSDAARSELVGFVDTKTPAPEASIAHQGFIQFLRSYVSNPPLWLREGFAVYFEDIAWDPDTKTAAMRENLAWLDTYKDLAFGARTAEAIGFETLLTLNVDKAKEKIAVFYPQAWALVNYLANSPVKADNRILWDSINQLSATATLDDNSQNIVAKAFKWQDRDALARAFDTYFKEKKTYREQIQAGIDYYANGKAKDAEASFTSALGLQDSSYVPYYYLGLISYDKADYAQAEAFYQKALDKGASPALTNYALGVNAFADNRYDAAASYLKKTVDIDPSFKDKADELTQRMQS